MFRKLDRGAKEMCRIFPGRILLVRAPVGAGLLCHQQRAPLLDLDFFQRSATFARNRSVKGRKAACMASLRKIRAMTLALVCCCKQRHCQVTSMSDDLPAISWFVTLLSFCPKQQPNSNTAMLCTKSRFSCRAVLLIVPRNDD